MLSSIDGSIIGVVGWKDSGKTTVVGHLVRFLNAKGFSVGTVKHVHDEVALQPGAKDSAKHLDAGAAWTVIIGDGVTAVTGSDGDDLEQAIVRHLWSCDYIVVEGFKQADMPKVAVVSREQGLPDGIENVIAVVYGDGAPEGYPGFEFDEIEGLAEYLFEKGILKEPGSRTSLVVNGKPVELNEFVQGSLAGVVRGFIATLRDTEEPTTIQLTIK
jgi:molybdopterin-guanine dinucleotide biosynthesis protein MobB